jgi:predicted nuclease with TOPRIM domain
LPELSKFDIILDELASLERQVINLTQKNKELLYDNSTLSAHINELEEQLKSLDKENDILSNSNSLNLKEREELKQKINELVNKIDYHLRS